MLPGNKDKTLRHEVLPVLEARPWHHFWHERYHRCVILSVENTEGGNVSIRFKRNNTGEVHTVVYPRDATYTKVWNIKMNNEPRYGHRGYKR